MAATAARHPGSLKPLDTEHGYIDFTSTTATYELETDLSEIYCAVFTRVGDASAAAGTLTIDETMTSGVISPASGAITVDRQLLDAAGTTLADEKFYYVLYGKS